MLGNKTADELKYRRQNLKATYDNRLKGDKSSGLDFEMDIPKGTKEGLEEFRRKLKKEKEERMTTIVRIAVVTLTALFLLIFFFAQLL